MCLATRRDWRVAWRLRVVYNKLGAKEIGPNQENQLVN